MRLHLLTNLLNVVLEDVIFSFNKTPKNYTIEFVDQKWEDIIFHQKDEDKIILYNLSKEETDSIEVNISILDSLNNSINQNSNIKFNLQIPQPNYQRP